MQLSIPTSTSATSTSPPVLPLGTAGAGYIPHPGFRAHAHCTADRRRFRIFPAAPGEFDAHLWRSYFDLDTDYAAIKARVAPRTHIFRPP